MFVRLYIKRIKIVQRQVRDFLACKKARIALLMKLWDSCEMQHLNVRMTACTTIRDVCYVLLS